MRISFAAKDDLPKEVEPVPILLYLLYLIQKVILTAKITKKCLCSIGFIDPFTKRHKMVHYGRFTKFEVLHFSQNTLKSIKIPSNL